MLGLGLKARIFGLNFDAQGHDIVFDAQSGDFSDGPDMLFSLTVICKFSHKKMNHFVVFHVPSSEI